MVTPAGTARERGRLHVSVASALEERILSGRLAVGDRLPSEAEIAREFAISTRSVREAMQILETKGLVRRHHGERAEVVRDDFDAFVGSLASSVRSRFSAEPDYLVQLMDVRRMFEEEAAGRLASSEDIDLGALENALRSMRTAVEARSFPDYAEADAAFHLALVNSVGNEILITLYENLYALITEIIRLSVRVPSKPLEDGLAEHQHMFDCIAARDAGTARQVVAAHVEQSKSYLQRALDGSSKGNNEQ